MTLSVLLFELPNPPGFDPATFWTTLGPHLVFSLKQPAAAFSLDEL